MQQRDEKQIIFMVHFLMRCWLYRNQHSNLIFCNLCRSQPFLTKDSILLFSGRIYFQFNLELFSYFALYGWHKFLVIECKSSTTTTKHWNLYKNNFLSLLEKFLTSAHLFHLTEGQDLISDNFTCHNKTEISFFLAKFCELYWMRVIG